MDVALLAARVILAALFAVAGVAKLADLRGSREAVTGFGVPARFAGAAGLGLPLVELTVAGLLLPAATASVALAGAAGLLLAFTAGIGVSIARGRAPDCHCFGQLHSEPAGPRALIRNAALLALAAGALTGTLADPEPSAVAWLGRLDALEAAVVSAAMAFVAAVAVWIIVRETRRAAKPGRMGLPEGADAPPFSLTSLEGPEVSLAELLRRGPPVVLVFTNSDCDQCKTLLPEFAPVQREYDHTATVAVVNAGEPEAVRALAVKHGLQDVLFDETGEVHKAYEVSGAPAAVRVETPGTTTTLLVGGNDRVREMVQSAATGEQELRGLPPGEPLPDDVVTTDLDGREVRLTDFAGTETLFLFWDPGCGSCREIREELLRWETAAVPGTPKLVLLTAAEGRAVRREGFRSPVLIDRERKAAEALGATGTPLALLVDAEGRVGWPLAMGRSHILRLIRSRAPAAALTVP